MGSCNDANLGTQAGALSMAVSACDAHEAVAQAAVLEEENCEQQADAVVKRSLLLADQAKHGPAGCTDTQEAA